MRIHARRLAYALVAGLAFVLLSACSANHTMPTPTASSLSVSCDTPALNAIGQQANCHARLTLSDSTTQDQTTSAQWSSSDPSRISVSSGGVIAAVAPGSAEIVAAVPGLTGRQTISVGVACVFSISPAALSFSSSGGSQVVTVTATPSGCSSAAWTAASTGSGLTFAPAAGDGNGTVAVTASANAGAAQTRTATIAGEALSVNVAAAPAPLPLPLPEMRTLTLTLTQGEQLSGPWAGTVTSLNGYSCTLNQRDARVNCPALDVEFGTTVDLLVTLAHQLVNLGFPIRRATGCDWLSDKVCRVFMNADKSVSISIGWSVSPVR
jgi:hypothetical protein